MCVGLCTRVNSILYPSSCVVVVEPPVCILLRCAWIWYVCACRCQHALVAWRNAWRVRLGCSPLHLLQPLAAVLSVPDIVRRMFVRHGHAFSA